MTALVQLVVAGALLVLALMLGRLALKDMDHLLLRVRLTAVALALASGGGIALACALALDALGWRLR